MPKKANWIITGLYIGSTLMAQAIAAVPNPMPSMNRIVPSRVLA